VAKKQAETNNEQLIQLATRAAQEGNKDSARVMFRQVYDRDNRNERALFGLAKLGRTPAERQQWLKRLLKVNPDHDGALQMLAKLERQTQASDNRVLVFGTVIVLLLVALLGFVLVVLPSLN
jgi:thioredoxin-like negative regulator of GroEL